MLKIKRSQLRNIIRESIKLGGLVSTITENSSSAEERQKIVQLYWNDEAGEHGGANYPQRAMARSMIDAFGLDPASLRVWEVVLPWGEFYEPWSGSPDHAWGINGYVANPDEPGFAVQDIEKIVAVFNSQNETQLSVSISADDRDHYWMQMDTAKENMATEEMLEDIFDGVSIAANKAMN
mgnify:CR=1 FL=1|jgi:hypothetical protein